MYEKKGNGPAHIRGIDKNTPEQKEISLNIQDKPNVDGDLRKSDRIMADSSQAQGIPNGTDITQT